MVSEGAQRILDCAAKLDLSITSHFVPWRESRNKDKKDPTLNWQVTLCLKGAAIYQFEFSAGCAFCPSYKQNPYGRGETVAYKETIDAECTCGKKCVFGSYAARPRAISSKPIQPDFADVIHGLVLDAGAIDYKDFEDWAYNFGVSADSIKEKKVYQACLKTGLALRNWIGDAGLEQLQDACQDY